jgi:hypothetical protein
VLADPPAWSVHASWVVLVLVIAYSVLRRDRALRGWVLLGGYSFALYLLLVTSRGQLFGRLAGLEYRYLTDVICVVALVVGLTFMDLREAPDSSVARQDPLLRISVGPVFTSALVTAVCLAGLVSSALYVDYWHHDNVGRQYTKNLEQSLLLQEIPPDLASQTMPTKVMPEYTQPDNQTSRFLTLYGEQSNFPQSTDRLRVIDQGGTLVPAGITPGIRGVPGPVSGCGWMIDQSGRRIALDGRTFNWQWWLKIGYLASNDSPVTVTAGDTSVDTEVRRGLHSLFVQLDGEFDSVLFTGLDSGTTLCVDKIEVGDPEPAEDQ